MFFNGWPLMDPSAKFKLPINLYLKEIEHKIKLSLRTMFEKIICHFDQLVNYNLFLH
jgi:hypothetical protein